MLANGCLQFCHKVMWLSRVIFWTGVSKVYIMWLDFLNPLSHKNWQYFFSFSESIHFNTYWESVPKSAFKMLSFSSLSTNSKNHTLLRYVLSSNLGILIPLFGAGLTLEKTDCSPSQISFQLRWSSGESWSSQSNFFIHCYIAQIFWQGNCPHTGFLWVELLYHCHWYSSGGWLFQLK